MTNFWTQIKKPFLALAPMAGITDQPFRLICKEFGADVLYSEMISSEALFHNAINDTPEVKEVPHLGGVINLHKTLKLIQFSEVERPYVVQIFGADPEHMAFAAEYISSGEWQIDIAQSVKLKVQSNSLKLKTKLGFENSDIENLMEIVNCKLKIASIPSGIDVNMGCPARDLVKTGAGAALLKDPGLAEKIIKDIKKKVKNIPISVKTRIGWSDNKDILKFARILEYVGADAIAIHGRTVKQGFSGPVDWETICKIKKALKIPVIGNGGINMNDELRIMNCAKKLDGIMIGNGALGRPWIFEKLKIKSEKVKTIDDIKKIVLKHAKLVKELKGKQGIIEFRKHLGWYFRGTPHAKQIRQQLVNVNSLIDVKNILKLKCKVQSVK